MNKSTNRLSTPISRRTFIAGAASVGIMHAISSYSLDTVKWPLILFSKHLGWMNYDGLAETTADLGFDGVDLTVRPGGHVLPENVKRDLPKATKAIRDAGLDVMMITTRIADPDEQTTLPILQTASELGIPYYRIGSYRYHKDQDILSQLNEWSKKLEKLAKMNEKYHLCAGYHNHSGHNYIGAPMWDIYEMLKNIDPQWIGCNYDAAHAIAEGGYGAWEINFRLLSNRFKGCAVKDSLWAKRGDQWRMTHPPVGQGITPWPQILEMLKKSGFSGPFSMHFEYEIPGEKEEKERSNTIKSIRRDALNFRRMLDEALA